MPAELKLRVFLQNCQKQVSKTLYTTEHRSAAYTEENEKSVEVASVESAGSATNDAHVLPPDVPRLQFRAAAHQQNSTLHCSASSTETTVSCRKFPA